MSKAKKMTKMVKKSVVILVTAVLCLLILGGFLIYYLINENKYYEIESRVDNVAKEVKKDKEGYKTVGWIKVQGTNIDYRVLYAPGFDFTLDMDSFAWTDADFKELNNLVFIQGHNVLNLSTTPLVANEYHGRFEQLMSYTYLDFVKINKYIQYTFNGEDYLYKIFAVSYPYTADLDFPNKKKYSKKKLEKYIKEAKESSIFDFDINVNGNDKIISLVTCTRMFGRSYSFKVDARLVRKYEAINNYDVKKTKEYSKVEEKMEGGILDETKQA